MHFVHVTRHTHTDTTLTPVRIVTRLGVRIRLRFGPRLMAVFALC